MISHYVYNRRVLCSKIRTQLTHNIKVQAVLGGWQGGGEETLTPKSSLDIYGTYYVQIHSCPKCSGEQSPSKFNTYWRPCKGTFGSVIGLNPSLPDPLRGCLASNG